MPDFKIFPFYTDWGRAQEIPYTNEPTCKICDGVLHSTMIAPLAEKVWALYEEKKPCKVYYLKHVFH